MRTKGVEAPLTEYLHRKAAAAKIPLSGTFELTPVCNMACKMCYVRMTKAQQEAIRPLHSAKEWLRLGEIAKEKGMLFLLLTGGEPFLHPEFRQIMEGLREMGFVISINSNGTMITQEVVEWLKECPPARINITLYGASDETYARLCGNPLGFTQTTNAIRLLKQAGISVKINCSLTPDNIGDFEQIFQFCKEEELIIQPSSYMFPPLRRDKDAIGKNNRFTPEEAAWNSARIEYLQNGKERFLEHVKNSDYSGLTVGTDEECIGVEGEGLHCRAGKSSFWVTWDGQLMPCGMLPTVGDAPNIFVDDFEESWQKIVKETAEIRLPAECTNCKSKEYCRACAAMVYTETGCYHKVPEYRCRMTKAYPSAVQKLAGIVENE